MQWNESSMMCDTIVCKNHLQALCTCTVWWNTDGLHRWQARFVVRYIIRVCRAMTLWHNICVSLRIMLLRNIRENCANKYISCIYLYVIFLILSIFYRHKLYFLCYNGKYYLCWITVINLPRPHLFF